MKDQEFLDKAHQHKEYERLKEYQDSKEIDAALLKIKNGEGITESYYEYTFTVDEESLSRENPHLSDFLRDIASVFEKYEGKGIGRGDWDSKGSSSPMALDIARDVLDGRV